MKTSAARPASGCPFFWARRGPGKGPGKKGPDYLLNYCGRFVCCRGKHASLLTYRELEVCMKGDPDRCPLSRAGA
ncbi:MAG: hypothetical protein M1309_05680 [Actinobacteria bacterium]|nr:hypothetical protein [Actinomycetota bacterium]